MASKHIRLMASVLCKIMSILCEIILHCRLFLTVFKPCSYSVNSVSVKLHCPLNSMAEHTNTELVSQFTEDAYATVDRICERPSCGIQIRAGEPCLYVATINPGQVGRHVCAACYARYENKSATSRRPKPTGELIAVHRAWRL